MEPARYLSTSRAEERHRGSERGTEERGCKWTTKKRQEQHKGQTELRPRFWIKTAEWETGRLMVEVIAGKLRGRRENKWACWQEKYRMPD